MTDVVVTGIGLVTSLGDDVRTTWAALADGLSGVDRITHFDASEYERVPDHAGEVRSDPTDWSIVDTRTMGRYAQFAVKAAAEALDDAELDPESPEYEPSAVGTSVASAMGGLPEFESYAHTVAADEWITPRAMLTLLPNLASSNVSIQFDARGPNRATSAACAAGSNAIADGVVDIEAGRADVVLAGGAEAVLSPTPIAAFSAMRGTASERTDPAAACRPFDVDRDGTVLGEGAGILVLERREHARERGATPIATIGGYGLSADAHHPAKPVEDAHGLVRALDSALRDAGRDPDAVDYVHAHATGTPVGDEHEAAGLNEVFDSCPPVVSTKSALGHTLGASGAVEAALSVESISRGTIPPTVNCDQRDEACDVPVVTAARDADVSVVASNSLGFGGTNCTLVLEAP